jgi:hypothetical protein
MKTMLAVTATAVLLVSSAQALDEGCRMSVEATIGTRYPNGHIEYTPLTCPYWIQERNNARHGNEATLQAIYSYIRGIFDGRNYYGTGVTHYSQDSFAAYLDAWCIIPEHHDSLLFNAVTNYVQQYGGPGPICGPNGNNFPSRDQYISILQHQLNESHIQGDQRKQLMERYKKLTETGN